MKKISFLFLFFIAFTSCKKFIDVNTSPNNAPAVPPSTILPTTTIALAFANANDLNRAASALVQHMAGVGNQVASYDIYNLDADLYCRLRHQKSVVLSGIAPLKNNK